MHHSWQMEKRTYLSQIYTTTCFASFRLFLPKVDNALSGNNTGSGFEKCIYSVLPLIFTEEQYLLNMKCEIQYPYILLSTCFTEQALVLLKSFI